MKAILPSVICVALASLVAAAPTNDDWSVDKHEYSNDDSDWKDDNGFPFTFTSTFQAWATPDEVVAANGNIVPGLPGANGLFKFGINSDLEYICYNIEFFGFPENLNYSSPAKTATHVHQAAKGAFGPPRLAFPNPQYQANGKLMSAGCLIGPFTTGLAPNGTDTGSGFSLKQIEANPSGFAADTHLGNYLAGAVRGQLY